MNKEIFSPMAIKNIVLLNQHICKHRPESSGVNMELLEKIFLEVNEHNNIIDKRKRIIKKATHILAGIIFYQPFSNGNKTTAEAVMKYFLRLNGYFLPMRTEQESQELIKLEVSVSPLYLFEDQYPIAVQMTENHLLQNIEDL